MGDLSKNFNRSEFECKCGCGFDGISKTLVDVVQDIRDYIRKPVIIVSGCRCPKHNKAVGGVSDSAHMKGEAADIMVKGWDAVELGSHIKIMRESGQIRDMTYCYMPGKNTIHIGVDKKKRLNIFGW